MSVFDVKHQWRAQRILQRALAGQRLPHAYIFHGPDGVGKEMLAVRFAKRLICAEPQSVEPPAELTGASGELRWQDACGECEDCRLVDAGTHPDYHVIYRELIHHHPGAEVRNRKAAELSVDVVRHFLIERTAAKPVCGRAKVFVVREVERASVSAQNALLKTLEEPPDRTFLILLASSLDRLLPTTRSRCQLVPFAPLPRDFVQAELSRLRPEIQSDVAAFLARYCDGQLGRAVQLFDDGFVELRGRLAARLAELTPDGGATDEFAAELSAGAKALAAKLQARDPELAATEAMRAGLRPLLAGLAGFYRDALQVACGRPNAIIINLDQQRLVAALAEGVGREGASNAIRQILTAETQISCNANVDLTLDVLAIHLSRLGRPHEARVT